MGKIEDLKLIRQITGGQFTISECERAYINCNGDVDKTFDYLVSLAMDQNENPSKMAQNDSSKPQKVQNENSSAKSTQYVDSVYGKNLNATVKTSSNMSKYTSGNPDDVQKDDLAQKEDRRDKTILSLVSIALFLIAGASFMAYFLTFMVIFLPIAILSLATSFGIMFATTFSSKTGKK